MSRRFGCLVGGLLAAGLVALILGATLVGRYNQLVSGNESIEASWADVENVLQRRADLIPNLVETVKGYAAHEREVFENVAEARSRLAGATTPAEAAAANAGLTSALGRLLAIAESYPELQASQNFARLQDDLSGTENRIAVSRKRYNDAVRAYNVAVKRFPSNLIASLFGFGPRDEYFEAASGAATAPEVEF
jgi:LemA protein